MAPSLNSKKIAPYVFISPFLLSFALFYLYPVLGTIVMSFQNVVPGETAFIGAHNYSKLLSADFFKAMSVTFQYTAYTILILIPMPIILAVALNTGLPRVNASFRAAFFLPSLVSVVVAGTLFRLMFASSGKAVINTILGTFGTKPINWVLGGPVHAMFLMVSLAVWRWTGVNIIYFMSGLQSISDDLYEAASIDGVGTLPKFFYITLPLLKPTIVFVTVISIFGGFAMFEESYMFWQGQSPNNVGLTMVGLIYQKGFQLGNLGLASAIGVVLFVTVFIVSMIALNLFGFFKKED